MTDRVLTTKVNKNDPEENDKGVDIKFKQLYSNYIKFRTNYFTRIINESDVSAAQRYVREIIQYELGEYTKSKRIPGVGFIPLNLQLTMDGLSGMKIYQTFDIDETLLPDEYKSRIRFIIRGVNHKIDKNGWETSVETLSLPKEKKIDYSVKLTTIPKDASGGIKSKRTPTAPVGSVNANRLREAIKSAGYLDGRIGKGTQLDDSGYDILPATADAGIAFINDLKKRYPTYKIIFTAGNDLWHVENSKSNIHPSGKALDISIVGVDQTKVKNPTGENAYVAKPYTDLEKLLINDIAAIARKYFKSVGDEYQFPVKWATAGHIHMNI